MYRKIIAVVLALSVLMLGGCSGNSAELAELSETEITEEASDTEAAAAEISETESEETAAAETEEVTETEAAAEEEKEISTEAKGTPANELYEVYPMRIIYPEKRETDITAEEVKIDEEFKKDGVVINKFSAAYPVFSGGNKEAVQKINGYIKAYVDNIYEELRQDAENYTFEDGFSVDDFPYSMCGFIDEYSFNGGYGETVLCDVNGNLLSVYFEEYAYGAGAMHGYETPAPMVFDLRTGERVDFNKIIGDADGLSEALSKALYDYLYIYGYSPDSPDNYAEYNEKRIREGFVSEDWVEFGFDKEGDYIAAGNKANGTMTVRDGCLCFYLAGYEYGSYADGIRRIDVPINDALQYLTEEGQTLFEGFVSAESKPVNIIEKNGAKSFDTVYTEDEWEGSHLYFSDKPGRS